jgi:manganese transport protein
MAGQVIMQGFVGFKIPIWVRRVVTMLPAFIVIGLNLPTGTALVISQVVLSIVLAFAVVPLVMFTSRRDIMGVLVNRPITRAAAWACAAVIVVLNVLLIYKTFGGPLPGIG